MAFDEIVGEIESNLLSTFPDLPRLTSVLTRSYALTALQARSLIYDVVANLNRAYFPAITSLELMLTEQCNLACTYCFEKAMRRLHRMTPEVGRRAIDLLFDYSADSTALMIFYLGGEPFLNFATMQDLTEYAEHRAIERGKTVAFSATSNCTSLSEERAQYLAAHNVTVLVSLDGLEASHDLYRRDKHGNGTFKQVLDTFRLLKRTQKFVGVKMTVMPATASQLYANVKGLYELGVNQFVIGAATGVDWQEDDVACFLSELKQLYLWYKACPREELKIPEFDTRLKGSFFGCQAGRNSISVAPSGDIVPCSKLLGVGTEEMICRLGDIDYGLTFFQNRVELVSNCRLRSECESLGIADSFQGGCFVENFTETGEFWRPSLKLHRFHSMRLATLQEARTEC